MIAPEAEVRVLLTADEEVRVARRAGDGADPATVREAVLGRDRKDSTVVEFHKAADGVVQIDTTYLTHRRGGFRRGATCRGTLAKEACE